MWDKEISPSGINIFIRDSASLVPDKNIHPLGEISLIEHGYTCTLMDAINLIFLWHLCFLVNKPVI